MRRWAGLLVVTAMAGVLHAETLKGRVVGVADGDTLTVLVDLREVRVRLAEIDAPEKKQPFGTVAKASLAAMTFGRAVTLDVQDTDRYGRKVARVYAGEQDVNLEQVSRGMAWAYRKYARDERIMEAESDAREAGRGLWMAPGAVPPWEWRKGRRSPRPPSE